MVDGVCYLAEPHFFSWGAYYSINKINFVIHFRRYKFYPALYFVLALADTFLKGTRFSIYIHEIGVLAGIITAVEITSYFLEKGIIKDNEKLANSSFFVISLHGLFILDMGRLLFLLFGLPNNTYGMLMLYFMVPVITIIIGYILYVLSKRYTPRLVSVLTGGR